MGTPILAEDFIAICLHLAKGDSKKSVKEVIELAEEYELINNRYFGTYDGDFRDAFLMLVFYNFRTGGKTVDQVIEESTFHEWMLFILRNFYYVYFKDTETYWDYLEKLERKISNHSLIMLHFFENKENHYPEKTINFLNSIGKGYDILDNSSR
jgi:hypothetical protein